MRRHAIWRERRTVFEFLGDTEVGDLDAALVVDEDIRTLDIAMDDTAFMDVVKALEDLAYERADERLLERAVVAQERGDGAAGDVLEEDVEVRVVRGRVYGASATCMWRGRETTYRGTVRYSHARGP